MQEKKQIIILREKSKININEILKNSFLLSLKVEGKNM